MTDRQEPKRIDTSLPFNDDLPSSSPSAKTTALVLGSIGLVIVGITLLVIFN